jgi:hypothetical protein
MDDPRYKEARAYVRKVREFYTHLAVFVIINLFLFLLDLITGSGWWFFWPLMGWGLGLAIHAYTVFVEQRFLGRAWEERKIQELLGEKPKRKGRPAYDIGEDGEIREEYSDELPLPDADSQRRSSRR